MKAVMISIHPEHIVNIAQLVKTIEMRRTAPLLKPPFITYIYCTNNRKDALCVAEGGLAKKGDLYLNGNIHYPYTEGTLNRKIIGEFTCDKIECVKCEPDLPWSDPDGERELRVCKDSCLTFEQIAKYGEASNLWAWHISELKLYDKPKALSEFWTIKCNNRKTSCGECDYKPNCIKDISRPPQSWCYVEEL